MKYKILSARTTDELEKLVAESLADGWSCSGGLVLTPASSWDNKPKFYQALEKVQPATAPPAKAKA